MIAGTIARPHGRQGRARGKRAPHLLFEIRPAGAGAPRIDPTPILDGWRLLESSSSTAPRAASPILGADARRRDRPDPADGQGAARAPRARQPATSTIYPCGRQDIRAGIVDRRVLATLEFLARRGLKPTVSALRCGHGS